MEYTILYIEDNPANIQMMEKVLTMLDYTMLVAIDGESGLAIAKSHLPDLILMDINLPGINGLETTRRLKSDPQTKHIPIIAYTAGTSFGSEQECLQAGCNAYIEKPGTISHMGETIDGLIHQGTVEF